MPNATADRRQSVALLISAGLLAVFSFAAVAGWIAYGPDIYMSLIDGILAWCM